VLLPERIISTRLRIRSICFRAAIRPCKINILKYSNISEPRPPITSTNSGVSLKGDVSNPKFRGDVDRMNPKSMWIRWPSLLRRILPLCLTTRKLKRHPTCTNVFRNSELLKIYSINPTQLTSKSYQHLFWTKVKNNKESNKIRI